MSGSHDDGQGLLNRLSTTERIIGIGAGGYLGSSEVGYSLRVRGLLGAGSRAALPLRFSIIFEYGGLIREYAPSLVPSCCAPASIPARQRIRCRSSSECWIAGGGPLV